LELGVLVQADESVMAVIKSEDSKAGHRYIVEELDSQTCMVNADRLPELEAKVKEVSLFDS
jgi:hypothetical protein